MSSAGSDVLLHGPLSCQRISTQESFKNVAMLLSGIGEPLWREFSVWHWQRTGQQLEHADDSLTIAGQIDTAVELMVQPRLLSSVFRADEAFIDLNKFGDTFITHSRDGTCRSEACYLAKQLIVIDDIVTRARRNECTTTRQHFDESLLIQGDQCLAHWQSADAKILCDLILIDAVTRLEITGNDHRTDVLGRILGQIAPTQGPHSAL
jgi:hypothetical protein